MEKTRLTFKRYEKKYLITETEHQQLLNEFSMYMKADKYERSTVCNIYYDTADFNLIRTSIEKPVYKEKLRVRSYGIPAQDEDVFIEIKKKYDGIVYKRRIKMSNSQATEYMSTGQHMETDSQIIHEIDWFRNRYKLEPKVYIAYDREALAGCEDSSLRITFDKNIRWRNSDLILSNGDYGNLLMSPNMALMEVKTSGAVPVWLAHLLSNKKIYPTSFSKYGQSYIKMINNETGVINCA